MQLKRFFSHSAAKYVAAKKYSPVMRIESVLWGIFYNFNFKCPAKAKLVKGDESIMSPKKHGTTDKPVMKGLKWNVDWEQADG